MSKKILSIFLIIFILSGCGQKDAKETVLNTYRSWREMQQDIWVSGISQDTSQTYEFTEGCYYKADDKRFQSIEDIKEATEQICTEEFAQITYYERYLTDNPLYLEKHGSLYKLQADLVLCYDTEPLELQVIDRKSDHIRASLRFYDENMRQDHIIDMEIALIDGIWLMDDMNEMWAE